MTEKDRKRQFDKSVATISGLCTAILSNADCTLEGLAKLLNYFENPDNASNMSLKQIVLVALIDIFSKIIPDSKIRVHTDKEMKQQMKQETKNEFLREKYLIQNYQKLLSYLFDFSKAKNFGENKYLSFMKFKSIEGLCLLYKSNYNFNFSDKILKFLLNLLNKNPQGSSDMILDALKEVFENDFSLDNVVIIIQQISTLANSKNFNINPILLEVVFEFNLEYYAKRCRDDLDKIETKKFIDKSKMSKKKYKIEKKVQKAKKDLESANAKMDYQSKSKKIQKITELLFFLFFKCLKVSENESLLKHAFKGISFYSHLLNIDFFGEIVELCKNFVDNSKFSFSIKLLCLNSFFHLVGNFESSSLIDFTVFYKKLFEILPFINFSSQFEIELISEISQKAFVDNLENLKKDLIIKFVIILHNLILPQIFDIPSGLMKNLNFLIDCAELEDSMNITDSNQGPINFDSGSMNLFRGLANSFMDDHFLWTKSIIKS